MTTQVSGSVLANTAVTAGVYGGLQIPVITVDAQGRITSAANTSNSTFVINSSGNVGIGTSSPSERLSVNGNVSANTFIGALNGNASTVTNGVYTTGNQTVGGIKTFTGMPLTVTHPGNTTFGTAIQIKTSGGTDDPVISLENFNGGSPTRYGISCTDNGSMAFMSGAFDGSFGTERMRIANNGDLTLRAGGSGNPTHQFFFNENGGEIQLMNAAGNADILFDSVSGGGRLLTFNGGLTLGPTGSHGISFITEGITRMSVTSAGNVSVNGNVSATTFIGALNGNAATVTNGVYTTGDQSIGGTKTFTTGLRHVISSGWSQFYLGGQFNNYAWFHIGGESGSNELRIARTNRSFGWEANPFRFDLSTGNLYLQDGSARIYSTFDSSGRNYSREWIEFPNHSGIYSPLNNAHFYPNNLTYGAWRIDGARNGWTGIEFSAGNVTLMMNLDAYGFHRNDVGWRFYVESGNGYFPGNVTAYWSDERLKTNLKKIGREALEILGGFRAHRFNWNEKVLDYNIDIKPGKEEIGLIAQHVQKYLPDAVNINKSGAKIGQTDFDYLTINYDRITPLVVEAVNIHDEEILELREKINQMEVLITQLLGEKNE